MEGLYSQRLEEFCELIGYHCLEGEDWLRGFKYNRKPGLKALLLSAYKEDQSYFEAALGAVNSLSSSRRKIERAIDLHFSMRSALLPLGRHEEWGKWVRAT